MTWTPVSAPAPAWISEQDAKRAFSPVVFSHAFLNGLRVFSMGSSGIWNAVSALPSTTWTAE